MKFFALFAVAYAAIAAAAPSVPAIVLQERSNSSRSDELVLEQLDLKYLVNLNSLDLVVLQTLGKKNNLDLVILQSLFDSKKFDLASLLQLQQLSTLLAIANTGILNSLDLARLTLGGLDLGLIDKIGDIDLSEFIDEDKASQITIIAQGGTTVIIDDK